MYCRNQAIYFPYRQLDMLLEPKVQLNVVRYKVNKVLKTHSLSPESRGLLIRYTAP